MPVQLVDRLSGVRPELRTKIDKILTAMSILGFPMMVVSGNRTLAEQQVLFAKGRTAPGEVVTNCDGVAKKSNHQDGRAVDCAFSSKDPWAESHPWDLYGRMVESQGLKWGGHFTTLKDRPHAELP